jgi:hypothetical protein
MERKLRHGRPPLDADADAAVAGFSHRAGRPAGLGLRSLPRLIPPRASRCRRLRAQEQRQVHLFPSPPQRAAPQASPPLPLRAKP